MMMIMSDDDDDDDGHDLAGRTRRPKGWEGWGMAPRGRKV